MVIKNTCIEGKHQKPIVTDIHFTKNQQAKPLVIFCHGYKGYKDWGAWHLMAQEFAKNDFFLVKFNFSHNGGTPQQPIDFPDLKAFGRNTFTKELDDLQSVIDWVLSHDEYKNEIDVDRITLVGHSRGGGIVTLKSAEDRRIKNVISWAGVSDFAMRFPTGYKLFWWRLRGVAYIHNARTKQKMPHYFSVYKDFKKNEQKQTISSAAKSLDANHLIVHGTNDVVVKPNEAENLHGWNPKSTLLWIENMDHALGCKQPWTGLQMPKYLAEVVQKTIAFIHEQA